MQIKRPKRSFFGGLGEHGMLVVLVGLCLYFSVATWAEQHPTGPEAARSLADLVAGETLPKASVLIVVQQGRTETEFAETLGDELEEQGLTVAGLVQGRPSDARRALERIAASSGKLGAIACTETTASWGLIAQLGEQFPHLKEVRVFQPQGYYWPNFLKTDNLLNIANQIAVIAIIAIGMTMVIITGGIDLSVGSLIALSAVAAALLLRDAAGGSTATTTALVVCSLGGIIVCAASGLLTGLMITLFAIPPFIGTLAMMLIASGLAYILADGQSINEIPDAILQFDRGTTLGIPNTILLMIGLYVVAHVVMTRTVFGRHVYAVGGNIEAARLSGVPVKRVIVSVYVLCGALAGLAGIIMMSRFKSGDPKYGLMYELSVIAAVVVGGTSLAGGEGRIMGTLTGAFIIAVIQNGMNLTNVESYTQKVVLGVVILGAVMLDRFRRRDAG
ncbi:Ribose transport system permease protein RbsC [Planctomycetes bacterium Pan216]|uniref:Ribose transport system permease protein RbsC n=1 Tax=Kolteria novifilia TaxID=2527975 RepID=A0A518B4N5_9BACT|nr:Ribose transport system permease protein RbsC [Planctomycetes bacterium Pan216]